MAGAPIVAHDAAASAVPAEAAVEPATAVAAKEAFEEALREILAAGGELLEHEAEEDEASWPTSAIVAGCAASPCRCHFLVGERRELGPRASVLLLAPAGEAVDAAAASWGLGLKRGLRPGPAEFCRTALHCEPSLLTPLAACAPESRARVAVSVGVAGRVAMRVTRAATLVCSLEQLLAALGGRGVRADTGVPCTPEALAKVQAAKAGARAGPPAAVAASLEGYAGECHWVTDTDEARFDEFRRLKGARERGADDPIIVEGPETIRMLLASDFEVEKLLLKPTLFATLRENLEARARRQGRALVPVYLCEASLMEAITGVPAKHASAALACALPRPALAHLVDAAPQVADLEAPLRVLALDGLDEEAVGALFRDAAAFGVGAVLLGATCGDPFSRRAVRVSMGHVFRVPALRGDVPGWLRELGERRAALTVAAVAAPEEAEEAEEGDEDASPPAGRGRGRTFLDELAPAAVPQRWACAIGPGGRAAGREVLAACALHVAVRTALPGHRAPLGPGVAASILLNGLAERAQRAQRGMAPDALAASAA